MKSPPTFPTISGQPVGLLPGMRRASAFIGVSPRTLFDWIKEGRVKVIRHSRRKLLFSPANLLKAAEDIGAEYAAKHGME